MAEHFPLSELDALLPAPSDALILLARALVSALFLLAGWQKMTGFVSTVGYRFGPALIGHHFWTMQGPGRHQNQLSFFKNLGMMGGLLLLAITGAGAYALA